MSPIRRSRARRLRRRALFAAGVLLALVANGGLWWAEVGRERSEWAALQELTEEIPDPQNPGELQQRLRAQARERLARLAAELDDRPSIETLGAVSFTAQEIARLHPDLAQDADRVRRRAYERLVEAQGPPPDESEDATLNPRRRVDSPPLPPFVIQAHPVTGKELRRFYGADRVPDLQPFARDDYHPAQVTWLVAVAYAAWLQGDLASEGQVRSAGEERFSEWCRDDEPGGGTSARSCMVLWTDPDATAGFRVVWPAPPEPGTSAHRGSTGG